MNKPSKKLLDLTIDITGERELEEFPKLLKLYTYALDMEVEIERLNKIIGHTLGYIECANKVDITYVCKILKGEDK